MSSQLKIVPKGKPTGTKAWTGARDAHDHLASRRSQELFIALSGPVGSGVPGIRDVLDEILAARGYKTVHIKISEQFTEQAERLGLVEEHTSEGSQSFDRIWKMQSLGNTLRKILGDDMAAQLGVLAISIHRAKEHPDDAIEDIEPQRTAYIIDQLKHPREVLLLRSIYGDMLYVVGVLCAHERRTQHLTDMGMSKPLAEKLMARDRKESDDNGQQLEKALQHADFFVSNSRQNISELKKSLSRFVDLIHGTPGLTPNIEERGMFAAYSAGLRSACLSRQVGAAIVDPQGNVISTGCNDVPTAGGGLYEPGDTDRRCGVRDGYCHNDKHKNQLREEILLVLEKNGFSTEDAARAADVVRNKTRVRDLIEFSRAVHAEMDAIIGVARTGVAGIKGSTLFTTVYPCHNCARHIVAAGVSSVVYIEPYEKSLAAQLHDDSILQEPEQVQLGVASRKVSFMHFEGVAPQKFSRLFQSSTPRKDASGRVLQLRPDHAKRETEFLDDYIELEARTIDRLVSFEPEPPKPTDAA
jgi:deoxycytidylate deaminase